MHHFRAALSAALLATFAGSLPAQLTANTASASYAPVALLVPGNARTLALGNTGVAGRDDPLFFNPAMLVQARGATVSGERFSPTSSGGAFSSFTPFNGGAIGIGLRLVNYNAPASIFPTNRASLLNDGPGDGTSAEVIAGIGQVIKGLRVGVAGKYAQENAPAQSAGRAAIDLGISKDLFRMFTFGFAVQNIGKSISVPCSVASSGCVVPPLPGGGIPDNVSTRAYLPLRTTFGASAGHTLGPLDMSGTVAASLLRSDFFIPSGGLEASYSWLDGYAIALRAGGRRPLPGEGAFTAGAGFNVDRIMIDYAVETLSGSRVGHRIGLRIR